jgi:hypothetical protein
MNVSARPSQRFTQLAVLLLVLFPLALSAQEFGFGFDGEDSAGTNGTEAPSPPFLVTVGGEVRGELTFFLDDFGRFEEFKQSGAGDVFSGALRFNAAGSNADGVIRLKLAADRNVPVAIDEAYVRGYFGPVNIEAGLRKLTWGKADSFGPLDVVNPFDYSDLSRITDIMDIKIARPMIHGTVNLGSNSKLEAVFVPGFEGHRFAGSGRWFPSGQAESARDGVVSVFMNDYYNNSTYTSQHPFLSGRDAIKSGLESADLSGFGSLIPGGEKNTLEYAQTGIRFTTSAGPADIGVQYFFGNLSRPSYSLEGVNSFLADLISKNLSPPPYAGDPSLLSPRVEYNRYHQIGLDWAQVIADFNVRGELAAHITADLAGAAGWVRNPFIGWSLGFDRDLVWGINLNFQCNETVRLFNDKNNTFSVNSESNTPYTATRLTIVLSRKFLRDNLELKCTGIVDPEDADLYVIPSLSWSIGDLTADFSAGFFTGKGGGEISQYRGNG